MVIIIEVLREGLWLLGHASDISTEQYIDSIRTM